MAPTEVDPGLQTLVVERLHMIKDEDSDGVEANIDKGEARHYDVADPLEDKDEQDTDRQPSTLTRRKLESSSAAFDREVSTPSVLDSSLPSMDIPKAPIRQRSRSHKSLRPAGNSNITFASRHTSMDTAASSTTSFARSGSHGLQQQHQHHVPPFACVDASNHTAMQPVFAPRLPITPLPCFLNPTKCMVCAKHPYKYRDAVYLMLMEHLDAWDWDGGIFGLAAQLNGGGGGGGVYNNTNQPCPHQQHTTNTEQTGLDDIQGKIRRRATGSTAPGENAEATIAAGNDDGNATCHPAEKQQQQQHGNTPTPQSPPCDFPSLLHRHDQVSPDVAEQIVQQSSYAIKKLHKQFARTGLLQHEDQNYTGRLECARVVAPLRRNEVIAGALLGMGGFSCVYEVEAFHLECSASSTSTSSSTKGSTNCCSTSNKNSITLKQPSCGSTTSVGTISGCERAARKYLKEHVMYCPDRHVVLREEPNNREYEEPSCSSLFMSCKFGKGGGCCHDATSKQQQQQNRKDKKRQPKPIARYAMKHLRHNLANDTGRLQRAAVDLALEGQLLMVMDHPNVIGIRGWSLQGPDAFRSGNYTDYFLILDKVEQTLDERIGIWRQKFRKYGRRLRLPQFFKQTRDKFALKLQNLWLERIRVAYDIATAMEYVHSLGIINRDVKCANVGFDVNGDVKIFDFGLSRLLPHKPGDLSDPEEGYDLSCVGTKYYMAPEIRNKKRYSYPADVYSFGITFWEILALSTSREVFRRQMAKLDVKVDDPSLLPMCTCWPQDIRDLLQACLAKHPNDRPTFAEVGSALQQHMIDMGMLPHFEHKRRRSTFRLDLSPIPVPLQDSLESTTSRCSSTSSWENRLHVHSKYQ